MSSYLLISMKSEISFWNYLASNRVVIPIIQRDYAQGRVGKESLREEFLSEIKQALDSDPSKTDSGIKLDFIYGSKEEDIIMPLDGQQRLTTLWLLHWFIAYKAGRLDAKTRGRLDRFTYQTRISSTEFCKALCIETLPQNNYILSFIGDLTFDNIAETNCGNDTEKRKIVELLKKSKNNVEFEKNKKRIRQDNFVSAQIMRQTWFFSSWNQDPTIQSMLRMFSGTLLPGKDGRDIIDGLEELFEGTSDEKFNEYFDRLTSDKSPIVFYQLPMEYFGLSDDLYIKMNARGKELSDFENFKADMVSYLKSYADETLMNPTDGLPVKFDTIWTDIFWTTNSKFKRTDEVFFTFINRFFFNSHIAEISDENDPYYIYFTVKGVKQGDTVLRYTGLNPYKFKGEEIPKELWITLRRVLDNLSKSVNECNITNKDLVHKSDFSFIPCYTTEKDSESISVTKITQIERVIFYSLVRFFDKGPVIDDNDKAALRQWTRVVRNIISVKTNDGSSTIRSVDEMKKAVKVISLLDPHDVYRSLRKLNIEETQISESFLEQLEEERDKAMKIINEDGNYTFYDSNTTWEDIIIKAEDYSFFDGAIRFLFRDAENHIDWKDFDVKFSNAKRYFKSDDEKENSNAVNPSYSDSTLLRSIISRFTTDNYNSVLYYNYRTFNNRVSSWRYYLLNSNIASAIDTMMKGDTTITPRDKGEYGSSEYLLYLLSQTKLLDFVINKIPDSWIRYYHNYLAIYPSSDGVFLNAQKRDSFFFDNSNKVTVADENITSVPFLFYKSQIYFKYKGHNFVWYNSGNKDLKDFIYLMNNDNPLDYRKRNEAGETEFEKYYCFDTKKLEHEHIFKELDSLILESRHLTSTYPPK